MDEGDNMWIITCEKCGHFWETINDSEECPRCGYLEVKEKTIKDKRKVPSMAESLIHWIYSVNGIKYNENKD